MIRKAERKDIKKLSDLATRTFYDTFGHSFTKEELKAVIDETRSPRYFISVFDEVTILLALENKKLVGYVQFGKVTIPEITPTKGDREITRVYVDSHLHRKGIGSKLLGAALKNPRMRRAKNVYLTVWEKNESAMALYKKYGFKECGEHDIYVGAKKIGSDLILIRKKPQHIGAI